MVTLHRWELKFSNLHSPATFAGSHIQDILSLSLAWCSLDHGLAILPSVSSKELGAAY
jgi:hypothetical protein